MNGQRKDRGGERGNWGIRGIILRKINYVQRVCFYIPASILHWQIRERMRTHLAICTRIMGASTVWREWLLTVVQHRLHCNDILLKLTLSDTCYCVTSCHETKIVKLLNNDIWQLHKSINKCARRKYSNINYSKNIYFLGSNSDGFPCKFPRSVILNCLSI